MTKINEIKKMKDAELTAFVSKQREVVREHRFGTGGKDVTAVRGARRDIARALTELQARQAAPAIASAE